MKTASFICSIFLFLMLTGCTAEEDGITIHVNGDSYLFAYAAPFNRVNETGRNFRTVRMEELFRIDTIESDQEYLPIRFIADEKHLFTLDSYRGLIHEYTLTGEYIRSIGDGIGRGPAEFESLFALSKDKNHNFYLIDIGARSIIMLNESGEEVWRNNFTSNTPGFSASAESGMVSSISGLNVQHIFEYYNYQGNLITKFESIVRQPESLPDSSIHLYGLPLTGDIEWHQHKLYFAPRFISRVFIYGNDGLLQGSFKTHSEVANPEIFFGNDPNLSLPIKTPVDQHLEESSLGMDINDGKLILWSAETLTDEYFHIFDIYDLDSGHYLYSYRIQLGSISDYIFSSDKLFTINSAEGEIAGYKIEF